MTIDHIYVGDVNSIAKVNQAIDQANLVPTKADQTALASEVADRMTAIAGIPLADPVSTRPGDASLYFITSLAGGEPSALPSVSVDKIRSDDAGFVVRLVGDDLVAQRQLFPIEPSRRYLIEFAVQRRVNSPDPDNDAIRCGIAFYDQARAYIGQIAANDFLGVTVGSGRLTYHAVMSRAAGDDIDIVSAASARYCRPFVQTFGTLVQSDVEVIRWTDITYANAYSPDLSDLEGRTAALESIDAGERITVLEAEVSAPNLLRFNTMGDAVAAHIGPTADTVELLGYYAAGDGGKATYTRSASEPPHAGKFISVDGVWMGLAEDEPNERMFGARSDGSSDDAVALNGLVQWAMIAPSHRSIKLVGQCFSSADIPNFHDVQFTGPGSVRIGTGPECFVSPNKINRHFSPDGFNHLFVDQSNGSDNASGLAPEFAFKLAQRAFNVIATKGTPIQGYWQIDLVEGVFTELNINSFASQSMRGQPIFIKGPAVDVWSISARPPAPTSITAITSTNPPVVTSNGHGMSNGDKVFIGLATKSGGGAHAADGQIFTVGNVTANTYELTGVNGTLWTAYAGSGKSYALKGSRPKVVFYGTGNGSGWGMNFDGNCTFWIYDIMGVGWGTKAGQGDEGLLVGRSFSNLRTFNVHVYDSSMGQQSRDLSVCVFDSGWLRDCFTGTKALGSSRYTFGTSNPSSLLDSKILYENDTFGADIWDTASGHVDGDVFIDCITEVCVRKNSHAVADHNSCTTSTRKTGMVVQDGGFLAPTNNTFTGDYRPTISRQNGGHLIVTDTTKTWVSRKMMGGGTFTDNTEHTIISAPVSQGMGIMAGDAVRFKMALQGTWSNGSLTIRAKADSTSIITWTLAANVSSREVVVEAELSADGFLTLLGDSMKYETQGSTQIAPVMDVLTGIAFDTQSAGKTFSLSVQLSASSGDTVTTRVSEISSLGW